MTLQEKLEMAARVMGWTVLTPPWPRVAVGWFYCGAGENHAMHYCDQTNQNRSLGQRFLPHTDDGDSRRLEIALRKHCFADHPRPFEAWPEHIRILWERYGDAADSGDAEQYRAAVLDLAAAIGEVINAA